MLQLPSRGDSQASAHAVRSFADLDQWSEVTVLGKGSTAIVTLCIEPNNGDGSCGATDQSHQREGTLHAVKRMERRRLRSATAIRAVFREKEILAALVGVSSRNKCSESVKQSTLRIISKSRAAMDRFLNDPGETIAAAPTKPES